MHDLRSLRKLKRATLAEVSEATGVDVGGLSRIERGEQFPTKDTATTLAAFYGVSVGTLVDLLPTDEISNPTRVAQ